MKWQAGLFGLSALLLALPAGAVDIPAVTLMSDAGGTLASANVSGR